MYPFLNWQFCLAGQTLYLQREKIFALFTANSNPGMAEVNEIMKKIAAGLSVVLAFGCLPRVAAEDVNAYSNIVGYAMIIAPEGGQAALLNLTQFTDDAAISIQNVILNLEELNASSSFFHSDRISIWTGTGYLAYGLYHPPDAGSPYWLISTDRAWSRGGDPGPSQIDLMRGEAVWFTAGGPCGTDYILLGGEVPEGEWLPVGLITPGVSIVGYPYASTVSLNEMVVSNSSPSSEWEAADKISLWTGSGYLRYGLYQPANGEPYWLISTDRAWSRGGDPGGSDVDIELGSGFWYTSPDGGKELIFFSNYYDAGTK